MRKIAEAEIGFQRNAFRFSDPGPENLYWQLGKLNHEKFEGYETLFFQFESRNRGQFPANQGSSHDTRFSQSLIHLRALKLGSIGMRIQWQES